jgi:hypothetical protein
MARLRVVRDRREKAALLENMIVDIRRRMLVNLLLEEVDGDEDFSVVHFIGFLTTYD